MSSAAPAAVQLSFTLRTSPNVRTVHLLGSWDNYKNQLPLSSVSASKENPSVKPGSWKGTFRFQGSQALKLGSRYWYYYIVDGYHVSHDPAKEFVTEPTTGRKLNILDVPGGKSSSSSSSRVEPARAEANRHSTSQRHSRHEEPVVGRALSPGKIVHPKPSKPYASRQLREADYEASPVEELEDLSTEIDRLHVGRHGLPSKYASSSGSSTPGSDLSGSSFSGSYGSTPPTSDGASSPSSLSSLSTGSCHCERYGITRSGQKVKLDCGGARCGYASSSASSGSECSSDASSDSEEERERSRARERMKREAAAKNGGRHAVAGGVEKEPARSNRHAAAAPVRRR